MPTMEELEKGFTLGDWEVLPKMGVLRRTDAPDDESERPENLVMQVLLALARRNGELVTQDELIDEVWDGRAQSNEPIQRCIALLRKHLGDTRPYQYIETLHRRGYRLLKPVELHEPADIRVTELPDQNGDEKRLWRTVAAVVIAGFLAIAIYSYLASREPVIQSIAILPMDNLSGDPANQYLVEGTRNSLAHRLAELQEFKVMNVRHYAEPDSEPSAIAQTLGVESLLYGALQMQGDTLKITWHIVSGVDDITVGSGEVIGNLGGVFRLQEQLAQAVRSELAGSKTPELIMRAEPESAAYNSFMRGMYLLERRSEPGKLEAAIELFEESITLDETFGPAYLALAEGYALLPSYRGLPLEENHALAIETVEKGISVDRSIENAAASINGYIYHQQKRWHESEEAHLRAVNAAVVDANSFNWYSRMLASVGRREDSLKWILAAENLDPDNPILINRIALTYLWLGNTRKAQEYFERAGALVPGGRNQVLGHALLLLRLGRIEEAKDLALNSARYGDAPADWVEPVFSSFGDPTRIDEALDLLDRHWAERTLEPTVLLIARTALGDVEGALEIARLLEQPGEIFEMDLLFIDEVEALRLHPEFIPLMTRLGVVDYWNSVGCIWEGSQVNCVAD